MLMHIVADINVACTAQVSLLLAIFLQCIVVFDDSSFFLNFVALLEYQLLAVFAGVTTIVDYSS